MNPTLHVPEHIHLPDKQHRDVYALRSVAVFEAIKVILVLAVGVGVWHYRHRDIDDIVDRVVAFFHLNPEGHLSNIFSKAAERMTEKTLVLVAIGAVIYSFIALRKLMVSGVRAHGQNGSRSSPAPSTS